MIRFNRADVPRMNRRMWHSIRLLSLSPLFALFAGGCMSYPEFVEAKDVRFFELSEVRVDGERRLKVRGLVSHSALAVENIKIERNGLVVHMTVKLTPARGNLSGGFESLVPLPDGAARVTFGTARTQIWPPAAH